MTTMKLWKRLLALATALLLIPCACLAEESLVFDLRFDMKADEQSKPLGDVLNMLSLSGRYGGGLLTNAYSFVMDASLTLDDKPRTKTTFSLYGNGGVMGMESSLFGDTVLMLNTRGIMEFTAKLYNHMGLPMDRLALLYPGATTHALEGMMQLFADAGLKTGMKPHTVSRAKLKALAEQLADLPQSDMRLYFWIEALSSRSGTDEILFGLLDQLPDYVASLPKNGITTRVSKGVETWTIGKKKILTASPTAFTLSLPDLPDGISLELHRELSSDGRHVDISFDLAQYDDVLLSAKLQGTLPTTLPISGDFFLKASLSGLMADELAFAADIRGEGDGQGGVVVDITTPEGTELKISGTVKLAEAGETYYHSEPWITEHGLDLFSMNDVTMNQIASQIAKPMVKGLLPVIAAAPASACAMMMDVLDNAGIFNLVASGSISLGGGTADGDEGWIDEDDGEFDPSIYEGYDEDDWDFEHSDGGASDAQAGANEVIDTDTEYEEDDWDF